MGVRSDVAAEEGTPLEAPPPGRGRRNWFWQVLSESLQAKIGLAVLLGFVAIAVLAPWIEPYDVHTRVGPVYGPPSPNHPLGLDDGGIDMVSLLIEGTRTSLIVGFAATLVAMIIGGGIGVIAGYFGGAPDGVLMRITDYFLVIPDLPLAIIVAAVWGASLSHLIIVIALLLWTTTARIVRAQVKSVRERAYVKRARSLGAGDARIILRHILPNCIGVISQAPGTSSSFGIKRNDGSVGRSATSPGPTTCVMPTVRATLSELATAISEYVVTR